MSASSEKGKGILLESGTNEVEFLHFKVCGHNYGINVAKVRQMVLLSEQKITKLPDAPPSVAGVIYFREKPASVIDLKQFLNVEGQEVPYEKKLLMCTEFNLCVAGFIVDEVVGIQRCSWKDFEPLQNSFFGESTVNVVGTITIDKNIILILDVESLLATIVPSVSVDQYVGKMTKDESIPREKVSIVYCEDSSIVQKVLLKTLKEAGFENFHLFPTGQEGLEFLKDPSHPPVDIILSDIEMPKMDGMTFCREVRGIPALEKTPFIFFSSMVSPEMHKKCKSVGGNAAFSKPEVNKIVSAIDKFIVHTMGAK